jgi:hypothetical protein
MWESPPSDTLQVHASQSWYQGVVFWTSHTDTLQVHGTERGPQSHLLNGSHTSVGDVETQGLIERGTICLFDGAEQLRQVTQYRERLDDFVEREWLGSWGSGREYGFCGSFLALGRSDARCDHFGRDARLESVKVFGEFALALDHRDPRPSDLGVFATILGISRDD